VPVIKAV